MEPNSQSQSWISKHSGALIGAAGAILAAIIGGLFLLASQKAKDSTSATASVTPLAVDKVSETKATITLPKVRPSFDCEKASWKSEYLICSSQELGVLDLAMANAYRDTVARMPERKNELRNNQNRWLRNDREKGGDISCLKKVYEERISYLRGKFR